MKITFIQTGGTIDKDYPHTSKGWAFEFGEPATFRILEKLDPSFDYEIRTAFQKDSLEITDDDRQKLAEMIKLTENDRFIVTHGTDSIVETADYLNVRLSEELVILTGAMRPERFSNSDAAINLGSAIGAANILDRGVFIAMHGIVKHVSEVKRDMKTGKFF